MTMAQWLLFSVEAAIGIALQIHTAIFEDCEFPQLCNVASTDGSRSQRCQARGGANALLPKSATSR